VNQRGRTAVRPGPVFLIIVAVFVLCGLIAWRYTFMYREFPARLAIFGFVITGWIVSLCLHEFGHAYFAYRSGDHSVATRGYLTLDPRKYADVGLSFVIPLLFILIGGIGLPGGAVWINRGAIPGRLRHSLISAAGPIANAIFAIALGLVVSNMATFGHVVFWSALSFLAFLQVTAAVLNLLPIPGLDGFGIIEPYLPRRWVHQANQFGGYAFLILIGLLWLPPINHAFFDTVYHLTDAIGIQPILIDAGHSWFQFWRPTNG
jgi:Zn-dependent protease